ncbi:amino acid adenylation domain-containing protein [Streptomyces sp. NPDC052051]|uniref:non-ribosomal peptide synthetase n=1 Tax=Streptomyces sp. NPDC052051 TaxID=3154649 RepID=UPI00343A9E1D
MSGLHGNDPTTATTASLTTAGRKEEALWILDRLVPSSGVNNLTMAVRAAGPLGEWELQETLAFLLNRHDVLRTVFRDTAVGLLKQTVDSGRFFIEIQKFQPAAGRMEEELAAFVAAPFAFDGSPLVRAGHFVDDEGDVFCLVVHHLVFDTISSVILLDEFAAVYDAVAGGVEPPAELLGPAPSAQETPPRQESLDYWRAHLDGFDPASLDLSCGRSDVPEPTLTGDHIMHRVSEPAREAVRRMQKELRAPEAVVLLAAYALLLARHGAGPDLVIGSPANTRGPKGQRAVGYHISTLPLRVPVDFDGSFRDLVARTRDVFFGALTHADVAVDLILPDVRKASTSWRNPVFKHVFNYVPDDGTADYDGAGTPLHRLLLENGFSKFDLEFFFISAKDRLDVRAVFYTDILDRQDVALMVERFEELLVTLGTRPDDAVGGVPVAGTRDRTVIGAANDTHRALPAPTVSHLIHRQVTSDPDAVAVVHDERTVSYGELWRAALNVRDRLVRAGAGEGAVVALLARRSPELAAAVLGTWLAGAVYLPLDPDHPEQRIAYQLDDSGALLVIADAEVTVPAGDRTVLRLPEATVGSSEGSAPEALPEPGATAYLIYTSGSTGRPKGTRISHDNLVNLITHFQDELGVGPDDPTLWLTTFSFDISALELLLPLSCGSRLVVAPDEARTDGTALRETVERHRATVIQATPTTWRLVLDDAEEALAGRTVLSGGEPLPLALARRLVAAGCELRNVYGPTETTIWSTSGRITDPAADRVDVGRPIANTRITVADPDGRELPIGVRGELCVGGRGVALGYHNRPELTADRFGGDAPDNRLYRTGDLARWLPDGRLEVLGRLDRQVKLRGHRIELGEIEQVLAEHPAVTAAAVVVADGADGTPVLTAFAIAPPQHRTGEPESELESELWRHALDALPRAATPQAYHFVDGFPMTGNDKVDYPALAARARELNTVDTDSAGAGASGDELLDGIVQLWVHLLQRADITPGTNFFMHGGHSVLGAQLVQLAAEQTGVRLKLADLFANPTPAEFARQIRAQQEDTTAADDH